MTLISWSAIPSASARCGWSAPYTPMQATPTAPATWAQ